jgi:hypothetical protein
MKKMVEDQFNDPEYRWYHKKEMKEVMTHTSERNRLGLNVINYEVLRSDNDSKIREKRKHNLDWDKFKHLVMGIPDNLDKKKKKGTFQPKDRLHFEVRDKGLCYLCGSTFHYGSCNVYAYTKTNYNLSHLHHIIPNGDITDENIITLCTHCHQMVHQATFIVGKWKYGRPL